MAGSAIIDYSGMIEYGRGKAGTSSVAGSAILGRRNMVNLRILAGGNGTVMARITSFTSDVRAVVIDKGIGKTRFVMTNGTITRGISMDRCVSFTPGS